MGVIDHQQTALQQIVKNDDRESLRETMGEDIESVMSHYVPNGP